MPGAGGRARPLTCLLRPGPRGGGAASRPGGLAGGAGAQGRGPRAHRGGGGGATGGSCALGGRPGGPSVSYTGAKRALRGCGRRARTTPLYRVGNSRSAPLPLTQRRPAPHDYAAAAGAGPGPRTPIGRDRHPPSRPRPSPLGPASWCAPRPPRAAGAPAPHWPLAYSGPSRWPRENDPCAPSPLPPLLPPLHYDLPLGKHPLHPSAQTHKAARWVPPPGLLPLLQQTCS